METPSKTVKKGEECILLQISHVKWIAILPPWKIIVFKMSKLCPSSWFLVLLLCLSSVILKFDCAAHLRKICAQLRQNFALLHQNFLLLLCSKSFRGDFISTYLRSLWISNLKLVSEQRKQSNKKQPKSPPMPENNQNCL